MRLRADVNCYHCGWVSGTWEWTLAASSEFGRFRALDGESRGSTTRLRDLRCQRCAGPVLLDGVETIVERPVVPLERPRRGRPPKSARGLAS